MGTLNFHRDRSTGIAEIEINVPDRRNALHAGFWSAFPRLLDEVDADPAFRVLILRAAGEHFSAGMDLDFFEEVRRLQGEDPGRYREWIRRKVLFLQSGLNRLESIRVPVIAVIQGACIGGGLDLICATNLRIGTADAFFRIHEIHIGMMADLGVLQRLPKLIPAGIVQELALTGRSMKAPEALQHGFLNSVHASSGEALSAARELAQTICKHSPLAVAGTKAALNHSRDHSVQEGLEFASLWNSGMFITEDVPNAIAAQKARSAVQFKDLLS